MNAESWERAKHAFHAALDGPSDQQPATIAMLCGDDDEARAQAARMLAHAVPRARHPRDADRAASVEHPTEGDVFRATPQKIGRFEIMRLVGLGATGKVYAASDPETGRTVAVKILRLNVDSESTRRRLEYEGGILARLDHPNIAHVFETGTAPTGFGALPYVAMQFVEGTPIDAYADNHNLDNRARVSLFADVCSAVAHAHSRGVIHRDLKPANILVNPAGKPLLVDFGIASHTENFADIDSLATHTGDLLGTPGYMSPEQRAGTGHNTDTRSDVYALGIILYELLARRRVFKISGMPLVAALEAIDNTDPPLLGSVRPDCRGAIESIVTRASHRNRRARYSSAAALAEDLQRFLAGQAPHAPAVTRIYKIRRLALNNRGILAIAGAVVLALCAAILVQNRVAANEIARRANLAEFLTASIGAATREIPGAASDNFRTASRLRHEVDFNLDLTMRLFDAIGSNLGRFDESRADAVEAYRISLEAAGDLYGRDGEATIRAMQVYAEACCMSGQPDLVQIAYDLLADELAYWTFTPEALAPSAGRAQQQRLLRLAMTLGEADARLGNPDRAASYLRRVLDAQARTIEEVAGGEHSDITNTRDMIRWIETERERLIEGPGH